MAENRLRMVNPRRSTRLITRRNRYLPVTAAVRLALAAGALPAWAGDVLPTRGRVTAGSATISQSANALSIRQTSARAVLDWQGFNVGANASVSFIQPSTTSVALNRVLGSEASQIYGRISANGQVFLVNPNGLLFARDAQVNVGGLLASTLQLGTEAFMAGRYLLAHPGGGSLRNDGHISATGSIALVGTSVHNAGTLSATTVTAAAGNTVAVDLGGDGLIRARVEEAYLGASIANSGRIEAAQVALTAGQSRGVLNQVVNNSGMVRAGGLSLQGGEIVLEASRVLNAGTLDASSTTGRGGNVQLQGNDIELAAASRITASGASGGGSVVVMGDLQVGRLVVDGTLEAKATTSGNGGFIETSAAHVKIADGTRVSAVAPAGRAGTWLIDPTDFTIAASGGDISGAVLSSSLNGTHVAISSSSGSSGTAGDINVNDSVSWSANHVLTLSAQRNIVINQPITASGASGKLALEYGLSSPALGNTAGYSVNAPVNLQAGANFSTKLGSDGAINSYAVITSLDDLQAVNSAGNYALGANIDATTTADWNNGAGFAPVILGTGAIFDGLGHTITGLTIYRPSSMYVAPFLGSSGRFVGILRNVGLIGGSVTGGVYVGGLVSSNSGTISGSYSTANVSGDVRVGGLAGANVTDGTISASYATGSVVSPNSEGLGIVGGLVGEVAGGTISNSYATGAVTGYSSVGGLVGLLDTGAISNSYATGRVSGSSAGGLLGYHYLNSGTVSGSYWDITTTQQASSAGGSGAVGRTTAAMKTASTFAGWSLATMAGGGNEWRIYQNDTYPLLSRFLKPITVTANPAIKTYDGLSTTGGSGANYSVPGAILFGTLALTADSANVGIRTLTPSGLYSNQSGYDISYADGQLTVTPAALTVTANAASKSYGATPALTSFSSSGLQNSETIGAVTLVSAGTAGSAGVSGSPYAITPSAATGGSFSAGNYAISYANGQLTINPATLTVTGSSAADKAYDATASAVITVGTLSGFVGSETVTASAIGSFDSASAGSRTATAVYTLANGGSGGLAANYSLASTSGHAATITPGAVAQSETTVVQQMVVTSVLPTVQVVEQVVVAAVSESTALVSVAAPQSAAEPVVTEPTAAPVTATAPATAAAAATAPATATATTLVTSTAPVAVAAAPSLQPVVKVLNVTVANSTVQKPADQIVQVVQVGKSAALVCR